MIASRAIEKEITVLSLKDHAPSTRFPSILFL
jgi:hypothetical protein